MADAKWFSRLLTVGLLFSGAPAYSAPQNGVLAFGAASLTDALDEVVRAYHAKTQRPVTTSYAASSVLARQIEAGAPADVFFCADLEWMDYLQQRGLLQAASRHDVIGNRLVLIAPAQSLVTVRVAKIADWKAALGPHGSLVTGDPESVPVGRYAKAALQKLSVWDNLSSRLVRAENVRSALAFVARGEAVLGIVYRTDALAQKQVHIIAEFPIDSYPPITYPIALTTRAGTAAKDFEQFVRGPTALSIFYKYGFESLP